MCVCVLMCMKAAWGLGFVGFFENFVECNTDFIM